jgi:hypothetical protein
MFAPMRPIPTKPIFCDITENKLASLRAIANILHVRNGFCLAAFGVILSPGWFQQLQPMP